MKKLFLVLTIMVLASMPVLAQAESSVSVGTGTRTGLIGFTFERLNNLFGINTSIGASGESIHLSLGSRLYMPDRKTGPTTIRSNFYAAPAFGLVLFEDSHWDEVKQIYVEDGYSTHYWGGITMGYDLRWGKFKEYRFYFDGGFGLDSENGLTPVPMGNLGLGYTF